MSVNIVHLFVMYDGCAVSINLNVVQRIIL